MKINKKNLSNTSLSNKKGYTLVELLVTIAIIGIISVPISSFFIANYSTFFKESNSVEVQQVARMGMEVIMTNMRKADQNSIEYINEKLEMTIQEKGLKYYLNGTNLLQEEVTASGSASNQLMNNVKEFRIEKTGDLVTVSIKVSVDGANGHSITLIRSHKIRI
ncbi:MAG: PilW family protein [Clostridia bacterium]